MPEPPVASTCWGLGSKHERLWWRSCGSVPVLTVSAPGKTQGELAEDCWGASLRRERGQGESLRALPLGKWSTPGSG